MAKAAHYASGKHGKGKCGCFGPRRLFCKRGHPRTSDNLYGDGNCRTCAREHAKRVYHTPEAKAKRREINRRYWENNRERLYELGCALKRRDIASGRDAERKRDRRRRIKEELVRARGGRCMDCGFDFVTTSRYEAAQFDHGLEGGEGPASQRGGVKEWGLQRRLEYARDLDLVCANCHTTRTYRQWREGARWAKQFRHAS